MSQSVETVTANSRAHLIWPVIGVVVAIVGTTTMDATGLFEFSAFVLLPLMFLFWFIERFSARSLGFKLGHLRDYGLALSYPIIVMGIITVVAAIARVTNFAGIDWTKVVLNLLILTVATFLVAIVTEEGFFRGWLWRSLRQRKLNDARVIIYTSVAFSLWHISAATIAPDFKPQPIQVPIFLLNAAIIGAIWGLMRAISGSIIVTSASHGLWNGLAYIFFGFGPKIGALGIANTALFGPEIGICGLAINIVAAIALWRWWKTRASSES